MLVQYVDGSQLRILQCVNSYSEEQTKRTLINGLPASTRETASLFWSRKKGVRLLEIARHTNTRLEQS